MEEGENQSQVVPLLTAALICDAAVREPATRKTSLIGIFDEVRVGSFPTSRPFSLYFKLSDAEGHYDIKVRYVQVASRTVLVEAIGTIDATNRLSSTDLSVEFGGNGVPIPADGLYEFQIWANDMFLGFTTLKAALRNPPPEEASE